MPEWLILLLVAVTILLIWAIILIGVGRISGWHSLSRQYPSETPFVGTHFRFHSAMIGWINYSGVILFGANGDGLQMDLFSFFSYGHPTIFIPWDDVTVKRTPGTFSDYFDLHFARVPHTGVRISARLGEHIAEAGHQNWPN